MKCAIHQFNPTIGALEQNTNKLLAAIETAITQKCDIFISSELSLCGYIPKDLLFRPDFYEQVTQQINQFLKFSNITILIGAPYIEQGNYYNSVFIIRDGHILARHDKQKLPNYGVFDECRYFTPGTHCTVFEHKNVKFGVIICEDMWYEEPASMAKDAGAEILISINASPFHIDKHMQRLGIALTRVNEINIPLIYVNQIGGQDDLVYDGASFILDKSGNLVAQLPAFSEELFFYEITVSFNNKKEQNFYDKKIYQRNKFIDFSSYNQPINYPSQIESVYQTLVLATRDYVIKNGFKGILLGLSGGVDSALTLAIAYDALGYNKVMAVMMPSVYTADISLIDSRDMVKRLGVYYEEIAIDQIFNQFKTQLSPIFTKQKSVIDITEENLQARTRGVLLMALSNKFGYLVLTTGNKSEMAVGYATLYGDMAGGFAVLKDVSKTLVYKLCNWRNTKDDLIPQRIITRAPSAELRENQTDQDSLPDYNILDAIIDLLVEHKLSTKEIIEHGFKETDVAKVARLLRINEYKRSQAAVGPRVTSSSFNNDRRYPITNHFQF